MSLGRHAAYNLAGFLVPMVLAVATVPLYLTAIGPARYGVLALVWTLLGYFGLFDLGLARAVMHRIASEREALAARTALATALRASMVLGLAGALALALVGHLVFGRAIALDSGLRAEIAAAMPAIAAILPLAVVSGVLNGALMGRQRFAQANGIVVLVTSLFQLMPLFVAWIAGPALVGLVTGAFAARLVGVVLAWGATARAFGGSPAEPFDRAQLRPLLGFGGWVTLTGTVGPLLVLSDRFVVGALMGAVPVTIYTVPSDLANRLGGISAALGNALFPRLAAATGEEARRLTGASVGALYAILTPPVAAALFLMHPALVLWLGPEIGSQSAPIGRFLLVATWLNAFAQMPFARLQAGGRPDLVGKTHLIELPFYFVGLWFAITHAGLMGAALVFLARVAIDTFIMFRLADRRLPHAGFLGVTLLLLVAASAVLANDGAALGWGWSILATLVVGLVALVPAWALAPHPLRAILTQRFVRRGILH